MDESLRRAAREGNVSELYRLIQENGNVLKRIDEVEFIDTPLHIAAAEGCIDFAMEIMSLKPSFARKLNQQGLSPIHLALENGHKELVLLLLENAKDLVRVKGKKGETPLHYVITREENPQVLLPRFLENCPECIRDLTTENQTALHIAVTKNKEAALKILCKMLRKTNYCQDVVNQKDRNGDTALDIAGRQNSHKMIKLLLKCKADKDHQSGSTTLDVAQQLHNRENISIRCGSFSPGVSAFKYKLQKKITKHVRYASAIIFRDMDSISSEDRSALLVILGLLLTATYQTSLSPPGSVWQGDSSSTSTTSTEGDEKKIPGKSVLNQIEFLTFYIPTYAVFIVTFFLTLGLLKPFPRGFRTALQILLAFLAICFDESVFLIAPTGLAPLILNIFSLFVFILMVLMSIAYRVSKVSVLLLGYWLFPAYLIMDYVEGLAGIILANVILGCLLFLFLYDEFWKGTIFVVGSGIVFIMDCRTLLEPILVLGCWLFLGLCRFCIKRWLQRCRA